MLHNKDVIADIRLAFATLQAYIKPGGPLNLTDINVHAEDFVGEVLNRVYSWSLKNSNQSSANYPCVDLLDKAAKVGVQVTSETGSGKINRTIECLVNHGMSIRMDSLKLFSLVPKQTSYTIHATCPGVAFAWRTDVFDFDSLLAEIKNITNSTTLDSIHAFVMKAMPSVFATRAKRLEACCNQLRDNLTVFDRNVMTAAYRYEDPVLMCRAIRQMRITLQKSGASRIANDVAAENFAKARSILSDCEHEVQDRYPYIRAAARRLKDHETLPIESYQNGDYGDAIHLMMEIRPRLAPLLQELEGELTRLEDLI